jgi:hypothetical protein
MENLRWPSNPSLGEKYIRPDGIAWIWNGYAWESNTVKEIGNVNYYNSLYNFPAAGETGIFYVNNSTSTIYTWDAAEGYVPVNKASFIDKEVVSGKIDGVNREFDLMYLPIEGSEHLYVNGLLQSRGVGNDYIIVMKTIVFDEAPLPGMQILCSYRKT